jgi:hypothetical protein
VEGDQVSWTQALNRITAVDLLDAGACLGGTLDAVERYGLAMDAGRAFRLAGTHQDLIAKAAHIDGYGSGSGSGYVYGYGYGSGYGDGYGDGYGYGYGYGYGDGSGSGYGYGYGDGYGDGSGSGSGSGYGYGDGDDQ